VYARGSAYARQPEGVAQQRDIRYTQAMSRATEDGLLDTEQHESLPPGPGHQTGPLTHIEFDRDSGSIRREEGWDRFLVVHRPPEKPASAIW
jgi:hypothetical protein